MNFIPSSFMIYAILFASISTAYLKQVLTDIIISHFSSFYTIYIFNTIVKVSPLLHYKNATVLRPFVRECTLSKVYLRMNKGLFARRAFSSQRLIAMKATADLKSVANRSAQSVVTCNEKQFDTTKIYHRNNSK